MAIRLNYAQQTTGITLGADGQWQIDADVSYAERAADIPEAITLFSRYLKVFPLSEGVPDC